MTAPFSVLSHKIWNSLLNNIRQSCTIHFQDITQISPVNGAYCIAPWAMMVGIWRHINITIDWWLMYWTKLDLVAICWRICGFHISSFQKQDRVEELQMWLEKHRFHINKLETLMRMLDNSTIEIDQVSGPHYLVRHLWVLKTYMYPLGAFTLDYLGG